MMTARTPFSRAYCVMLTKERSTSALRVAACRAVMCVCMGLSK